MVTAVDAQLPGVEVDAGVLQPCPGLGVVPVGPWHLQPSIIHGIHGALRSNRAGVVFITSLNCLYSHKEMYIINAGSTSKSKSQPCPEAILALPEHREAKAYVGC